MSGKEKVFGSIFFIAQQWQKKGDKVMKEKVGITTKQWMLLVMLEKTFSGYIPTLSEAAEAFGTSRQNLKKIAESLQKKGFTMLLKDIEDSRIVRVALTGKHRPFFEGEKNEEWQQSFIEDVFRGISDSDMEVLSSCIDTIVVNIYNKK